MSNADQIVVVLVDGTLEKVVRLVFEENPIHLVSLNNSIPTIDPDETRFFRFFVLQNKEQEKERERDIIGWTSIVYTSLESLTRIIIKFNIYVNEIFLVLS